MPMGEIGGDARLDQYLPLALGGRSCRRAGPWTRSTTAPAVRRAMCACAKPAGGSASSRRSRTISANLQSRAADLLAQLTRCAFRQPMKRSARRACNSRPEGAAPRHRGRASANASIDATASDRPTSRRAVPRFDPRAASSAGHWERSSSSKGAIQPLGCGTWCSRPSSFRATKKGLLLTSQ
jgi:hypothetical protein